MEIQLTARISHINLNLKYLFFDGIASDTYIFEKNVR